MLDPTPEEEYFNRLGATSDKAKYLAEYWGSVDEFLLSDLEEKLQAVVGGRQATAIAGRYDDIDHLRDVCTFQDLGVVDGVGRKSASKVSRAYIPGSSLTPRDLLAAEDLGIKVGVIDGPVVEPPPGQATLEEVATRV